MKVSVGGNQETLLISDEGINFKLERVPSRKELIDKLGYDPERLKAVMGQYMVRAL